MQEPTILSNLAEKQAPESGDVLVIEDTQDTKKISFLNLFNAIKNKLALKTVATTGNYNDLSGKPILGEAASKAVANNCTTTTPGSVLDARQGEVIKGDITALSNKVGNLPDLTTSEKGTIVAALNELKTKNDELNSALAVKIGTVDWGSIGVNHSFLTKTGNVVQFSAEIRMNTVPEIKAWDNVPIAHLPVGYCPKNPVLGTRLNLDNGTDIDATIRADSNGNISIMTRGDAVNWKALGNGNGMRFNMIFIVG